GFVPPPPPVLIITTASLTGGTVGVAYSQTIAAIGGTGNRTFNISVGTLPAGVVLNAATGALSGTPTAAGMSNFTVRVVDSGAPQQNDTQALSITINATAIGRNDSIANATPLGNGSFAASISPSGHPNTVFDPDEDYYRITTTAASTVTIDINAQINGSPLDSVIEIVGANGVRLNTCVAPAFNSACMHDDEQLGVTLDSFLQIRVAGPTTFHVHVVDWRFDGRPDQLYDIVISGVN
ncbi:MAG: Ig domain-containing protein, partial [Steroidobacteraceae bacterium]